MADSTVTPGTQTTEWKAWIVAIAGALALGIGSIVTAGLVPEGSPWHTALALVAAVLAAIGGVTVPVVTSKYIGARTAVKVANAAVNAAAPDPK